MKVVAVKDKALLGRGIFAIFSSTERAEKFLRQSAGIIRQCGEIAELTILIRDGNHTPSRVFAAYLYDDLYDSHILDGLYEDPAVARDVAGAKGHIVEFMIDVPE